MLDEVAVKPDADVPRRIILATSPLEKRPERRPRRDVSAVVLLIMSVGLAARPMDPPELDRGPSVWRIAARFSWGVSIVPPSATLSSEGYVCSATSSWSSAFKPSGVKSN